MANLGKIQIIGLKNFFGRFAKNLSWLFFAVFLFLVLLEVFELQKSAALIINFNQEPTAAKRQEGVRINFENYDKVVQKIKLGQSFYPNVGVNQNPFGAGK